VGDVFAPKNGKFFFKLILPVNTAKKTITTTKPKMNDKTLLKLSI
jgi:hypothetical protein